MKKILLSGLVAVLLLGLAGCDDDTKKKAKEVVFINQSRWAVTVIPLTLDFQMFYLAPGEKRKLHDIEYPEYRYEPESRVQESGESRTRYTIFIDRPPEKE